VAIQHHDQQAAVDEYSPELCAGNQGNHRSSFVCTTSFFDLRRILEKRFSFLAFATISYQIAGAIANERALLITGHMKAMGLLDSARML